MTTYKLVEKIGAGSYSKVYKAISQQNKKVLAIKVINKKDAPLDYIKSRQIRFIKECSHPNIAPLLDCIFSSDSTYLVFEYYPMNLNQFYKHYQKDNQQSLDIYKIYYIMTQICSAIAYLHAKNIIHRDIKPQNIMIDPQTLAVKLIDFGFATRLECQNLTGYMVTRWYRPLQVVVGLGYDEKIDVFGCACIFLELLKGRQIFESSSNMDQLHLLVQFAGFPPQNSREKAALQKLGIQNKHGNPLVSQYLQGVDDPIKSIIVEMMSNSAQQRPPITKLLNQLINQPSKNIPSPNIRQNRLMSQSQRRSKNLMGLSLVSMTHLSKSKGKQMGNPSVQRMKRMNNQIQRVLQKVK